MFDLDQEETKQLGAVLKVVGVGGGGCNAVNTMIKSGLSGVDYLVANTDAQALSSNMAPVKLQLGIEITKGLGAGANPEVGKKAALEEYEKIAESIQGSDMIFITAGMGGGTGTGAAPVIAKLAREMGILTVGVVTKPFGFEGKKRMRQALEGITALEESVDSLITIPNERLLQIAGENLSLIETFKKADAVLLNAVQGISDLINNTGLINADFADVKTVIEGKGMALMGTGFGSGQDRAVKAANEAISSPLLEDISVEGATGIIINVTGNESLTTYETNQAVSLIMEAADEEAEIIFGTVIDDNMDDEIKVTVIATGLRNGYGLSENRSLPLTSNLPNSETSKKTEEDPKTEEITEDNILELQLENEKFEEEDLEEAPSKNLEEDIVEAMDKKDASEKILEHPSNLRKKEREEKNFPKEGSAEGLRPRSKSIAERLGFISFEEDEFDVPSYIRNNMQDEVEKGLD